MSFVKKQRHVLMKMATVAYIAIVPPCKDFLVSKPGTIGQESLLHSSDVAVDIRHVTTTSNVRCWRGGQGGLEMMEHSET